MDQNDDFNLVLVNNNNINIKEKEKVNLTDL